MCIKKHILKQLKDDRNEIKQFWLRKTKKMVIAVLMCKNNNKCYYNKKNLKDSKYNKI